MSSSRVEDRIHRQLRAGATDERTDRWLVVLATCFAAAELFHGFDHLRRGVNASPRDVFWLGTLGTVLEVSVVVLVVQRHRLAPLVAAVGGTTLAAGYFAVHFLPRHPWFSDSFTSASGVSRLSWIAAYAEVLTAGCLAAVGAAVLRQRGGVASAFETHPAQPSLAEAVRQPLALVMIAGNAAILAASLIQLRS